MTNAEYHLAPGQIAKIIEAASSPRDKILIQLLAETGLRRAEVAALEIADLNFDARLILVRCGKGNKSRYVPMTVSLCFQLKAFVEPRTSGFVFKSTRSDRLSPRQVNRIVAKASAIAGITNPNPKYRQVTPHLFRHSFARMWKDRGGSIEALSKIMGHQSTKTTWDLYGTLSLEDIQRHYQQILNGKKKQPE